MGGDKKEKKEDKKEKKEDKKEKKEEKADKKEKKEDKKEKKEDKKEKKEEKKEEKAESKEDKKEKKEEKKDKKEEKQPEKKEKKDNEKKEGKGDEKGEADAKKAKDKGDGAAAGGGAEGAGGAGDAAPPPQRAGPPPADTSVLLCATDDVALGSFMAIVSVAVGSDRRVTEGPDKVYAATEREVRELAALRRDALLRRCYERLPPGEQYALPDEDANEVCDADFFDPEDGAAPGEPPYSSRGPSPAGSPRRLRGGDSPPRQRQPYLVHARAQQQQHPQPGEDGETARKRLTAEVNEAMQGVTALVRGWIREWTPPEGAPGGGQYYDMQPQAGAFQQQPPVGAFQQQPPVGSFQHQQSPPRPYRDPVPAVELRAASPPQMLDALPVLGPGQTAEEQRAVLRQFVDQMWRAPATRPRQGPPSPSAVSPSRPRPAAGWAYHPPHTAFVDI